MKKGCVALMAYQKDYIRDVTTVGRTRIFDVKFIVENNFCKPVLDDRYVYVLAYKDVWTSYTTEDQVGGVRIPADRILYSSNRLGPSVCMFWRPRWEVTMTPTCGCDHLCLKRWSKTFVLLLRERKLMGVFEFSTLFGTTAVDVLYEGSGEDRPQGCPLQAILWYCHNQVVELELRLGPGSWLYGEWKERNGSMKGLQCFPFFHKLIGCKELRKVSWEDFCSRIKEGCDG